jgi:uncharacterized protein YabN with tetrapyrrole methylase and pyrophosphatase domain
MRMLLVLILLGGTSFALVSAQEGNRRTVWSGTVGQRQVVVEERTKVGEEVGEVQEALTRGDDARVADELGDLLFSIVNVARLRGMDAEDCLRRASEKFTRRFGKVETEMKAGGRTVTEASAEDLDRAWEAAKAQEQPGHPEPGIRS